MRSITRCLVALSALLLLTCCKPPLREAESLIQAGNYARAERVLSELVLKDDSGRARALLAQARFHTDGPEVAIEQLQELYPKYQDDQSFKLVIDSLENEFAALDKLTRAEAAELEAYLKEKHPDWFKARVAWLLANQRQQGFDKLARIEDPLVQQLAQWHLAGKDVDQLTQLLSDHPDSRLRAAWYQALAERLWQAKRHDETLELLRKWEEELPERHPRRAQVLLTRADYALEAKQPAIALQDYRSFLRLFPEHPAGRETLYRLRSELGPYLKTTDHRFLAEQAYERWMYQTAYAELAQVPAESAQEIYRLGEYALEAKLFEPAREAFQRLQKFYKGSREAGLASVGLASIQRGAKAYGAALQQLAAIKSAYGSEPEVKAAALWEESKVYDFQNKNDLRAKACHEVVETDPAFKEAMSALWYAIWDDYSKAKYQQVIDLIQANKRFFAKHELKSRFLYWQARAREELGDRENARLAFEELSRNPLMDYYTHRARERLRLIAQGGEDRYATAPYNGVTRANIPRPGYASAFRQAIAGDKEAFSETMELYYLGMQSEFTKLAQHEEQAAYQVLYALQLHKQQRYYEAITRYRYIAEKDDAFLPAVFPLAFYDQIEKEAKANSLNPFLVAGLIWQESQYKPDIKSWVGATGLMQIMPATGAQIAGNLGLKDFQLTDAATNIRMGTWYLRSRLDVFDGNPLLAVASYNAGAGPVERWRNDFGHLPYDGMAESITYPETRGYVKRVFTSYWIYQSLYGK